MNTRAPWPLFGLSLTALMLMAEGAAASPALPGGGTVTAGSAGISGSGATLTVTQSSNKAIIDWSSFSIGQGGAVQFNNGSGATLNRVTGGSLSAIDGTLSATGSVYLINPNGVIVGKTGVVNTGGTFIASTLNTSDAAFLAGGDLTFTGASTASVINLGKVGSLGGDVVLAAATVSNAGSISAQNGTAGLIAGQSVLLRDQALDDGKFAVLVGGASSSATNSGLIQAANAELRAEGGNVYALAGDTTGVIRATGVQEGDGKVWLVAEGGGSTTVVGEITARGPDNTSGFIETSGTTLNVGAAKIDAGAGGTWLLDPYDLTIDANGANTISTALNANTNVTEKTTATGTSGATGSPGDGVQNASGAGDIIVAAPISWSTGATFTLDAYHSIAVNAAITASAGSQVVLKTNDGGTGGALSFGLGPTGFAGSLNFTNEGAGPSLIINGNPYALIFTTTELTGLSSSTARSAIANNIALGASHPLTPIQFFYGTLEGLGHTVSFTTNNSASSAITNNQGFIGVLENAAAVNDLGVTGSITPSTSASSQYLGGLIGSDDGTLANDYSAVSLNGVKGSYIGGLVGGVASMNGPITGSYATGAITGSGAEVGGLVGLSYGVITSSYATGAVAGKINVGGLVGEVNRGSIVQSYATGSVQGTGADTGGLVGQSAGAISSSYATGVVGGATYVGGLVGSVTSSAGVVSGSYATGAVTGSGASVGGLIGILSSGSVAQSYATGAVTGSANVVGGLVGSSSSATISGSYASGKVVGISDVGGLVGNVSSGTITDVYATGIVSAAGDAGGLVGFTAGTINDAYATGAVSVSGTYAGGFAGYSQGAINQAYSTGTVSAAQGAGAFLGYNNGGSLSNTYYDTTISGATPAVGSGMVTAPVGLTTAQFMNPANFTGFTFTTTPGATGNAWVIVDADSTLNGVGGATGATRPMLASEYSVTVGNAHQLELMVMNLSGAYTLGGNVNASGTTNASDVWGGTAFGGFVPVGQSGITKIFQGSLNGEGYSVSGLTVARSTTNSGLFGVLYTDASVSDLTLTSPSVTGASREGALAGYNLGAISQVTVNGGTVTTPSGGQQTGGVVGYNTGTMTGDTSTATVSGGAYVGGLLGLNIGVVNGGTATGAVLGVNAVGGLVGQSQSGGVIENVAADAAAQTVGGATNVGGLVGYNSGVISNAAANSTVTATGVYSGGLAGYNAASGSISQGVSHGSVMGAQETGGLVGYSAGPVSTSGSTSSVTGTSYVGGLIGYSSGATLNDDIAQNTVSGVSYVGGLVGELASGTINGGSETLSGSTVTATGNYSGGLAGYNAGAITGAVSFSGVSGAAFTGGLAGYNASGGTIDTSSALGASTTYPSYTNTVSGTQYVGGLVGENIGSVTNSGASINITDSGRYAGGLIGYNTGTVSGDHAGGNVSGSDYVGGLIGYNTNANVSSSTASGSVTSPGSHKGPKYGYSGGAN